MTIPSPCQTAMDLREDTERTFHWRKLENSEKMQRVLRLLLSGNRFSTMDIIHGADVAAVNAYLPEIRANGIEYDGAWGRDAKDNQAYFYWLTEAGRAEGRRRLAEIDKVAK